MAICWERAAHVAFCSCCSYFMRSYYLPFGILRSVSRNLRNWQRNSERVPWCCLNCVFYVSSCLFKDDFCLLWAHLMYNYVLRVLQIKLSWVILCRLNCVCSFSIWYLRQDVEFDCIGSWSLPFHLLFAFWTHVHRCFNNNVNNNSSHYHFCKTLKTLKRVL